MTQLLDLTVTLVSFGSRKARMQATKVPLSWNLGQYTSPNFHFLIHTGRTLFRLDAGCTRLAKYLAGTQYSITGH